MRQRDRQEKIRHACIHAKKRTCKGHGVISFAPGEEDNFHVLLISVILMLTLLAGEVFSAPTIGRPIANLNYFSVRKSGRVENSQKSQVVMSIRPSLNGVSTRQRYAKAQPANPE